MNHQADAMPLLLMFLAFLAGGLLALEFGPAWLIGGFVVVVLIGVVSMARPA